MFAEHGHVVEQVLDRLPEKDQANVLRPRGFECTKLFDEPIWTAEQVARSEFFHDGALGPGRLPRDKSLEVLRAP